MSAALAMLIPRVLRSIYGGALSILPTTSTVMAEHALRREVALLPPYRSLNKSHFAYRYAAVSVRSRPVLIRGFTSSPEHIKASKKPLALELAHGDVLSIIPEFAQLSEFDTRP
jgi:hypothetical protein